MLRKAVSQGFRDTDKLCLEACKAQKLHAGATCVAVWVLGSTLIVASIGVYHQVRPYSACLIAAHCRSLCCSILWQLRWQTLMPLGKRGLLFSHWLITSLI